MASGDRIELLTADTFETAMSTVAKEDSVANVQAIVNAINTNLTTTKTNVDTANTNINTIKTSVGTASTAPSVTSAGGVVNTANTIQQKLQGLSQYQIGATNSTGGSATAGNVMAKLNTIINQTGSSGSLIPSVSPNKLFMCNNIMFSGAQTLINVQGSGYLYDITCRYVSNMIVKIDNLIVFNCSFNGVGTFGIITADLITHDEDGHRTKYPLNARVSGNVGTFSNGVYTSGGTANEVCIPILPLRFSSSLVVTSVSANNYSNYDCVYILD